MIDEVLWFHLMPISQEILKITNFYLSFKITNFITTALSHAEQQARI